MRARFHLEDAQFYEWDIVRLLLLPDIQWGVAGV